MLIQLWRRWLEGKNLETGLISTHSLVHLQKQRLHYCPSTFYKRPAASGRVSSIGRTLHRYRRSQGFESRTSLNFFRVSFHNCKSCVYNCDDLLSYNTSTNSQTTTPKLSTVRDKIWWARPPCEWQEHHHCHGTLYMCLGNGVNQSFTKLHSGESDEAIK